jgi:uncharacterized surface protein with fasciclin (FAS1) repeats
VWRLAGQQLLISLGVCGLAVLLNALLPATLATPQVLSYHVIPGAAIPAAQLRNRQTLTTALAGAEPLGVRLDGKRVRIVGATNSATVVVPDMRIANGANSTVVLHVVDDVLLPRGIGKGRGKNGGSG